MIDEKNDESTEQFISACGYNLNDEQRFELIKEGFLLEDNNNQGFNFFSKLNYVYNDEIYARHYNNEIWRIIYLGQPSIIKNYEGEQYSCGGAYGYPINVEGGLLKYVKLGSIKFLNNYKP